jgi:hypothetical protein
MSAKIIWGIVLGLALVSLAAPAGTPAIAMTEKPVWAPKACMPTSLATDDCPGERWSAGLKTCVCAPAGACSPPPHYVVR